MRYLTRSYVEYLGLELIPIHKARTTTSSSYAIVHYQQTLPSSNTTYASGVALDDNLYERESDGLAYTRL